MDILRLGKELFTELRTIPRGPGLDGRMMNSVEQVEFHMYGSHPSGYLY